MRNSPILLEETLVFLILECVQFINVLVLKSIPICLVLCLDQGFLDQWLGVLWFLGDNSMLTKNIIPRYIYRLVVVAHGRWRMRAGNS